MITGIHTSVLFGKEIASLEAIVCVIAHGKGWAKTLVRVHAEEKITALKFSAKVDLLCGVSAVPVKSLLQNVGKKYCQEVPKGSRHRTLCERAREERFYLGWRSTESDEATFRRVQGTQGRSHSCSVMRTQWCSSGCTQTGSGEARRSPDRAEMNEGIQTLKRSDQAFRQGAAEVHPEPKGQMNPWEQRPKMPT